MECGPAMRGASHPPIAGAQARCGVQVAIARVRASWGSAQPERVGLTEAARCATVPDLLRDCWVG